MKPNSKLKIMRKMLILSVLTGGLLFVSFSDQLARTTCAGISSSCDFVGQMQLFGQCDGNLYSTVQAYNTRDVDCEKPVTERCDPADPGYIYCVNETPAQCETRRENSFDSRYSTYGNCVTGMESVMYNPAGCTPSIDPCPDVVYRVDQCRLMFPVADPLNNPEEYLAQKSCIESIPHVVPSKGGLTCPGTGYIPE